MAIKVDVNLLKKTQQQLFDAPPKSLFFILQANKELDETI